jgi:chromosome condensin MukBEF MukE localization factor
MIHLYFLLALLCSLPIEAVKSLTNRHLLPLSISDELFFQVTMQFPGTNHVSRFFANVRSGDAHRNANVGLPDGDGIIDAVTSHPDDVAATLQRFDDLA